MNRVSSCLVMLMGMLLSVGCGGKVSNSNFHSNQFMFSGDTNKYVVYTPPGYDATRKYPAILFLHGLFEKGSDGTSQTGVGIGPAIDKHPEQWRSIVIMAQTPTNWQTPDSVNLAAATLDDACKKYSIDQSRIVVTGLSNGGAGVWLLGAKYPGRFAGLAPLCAFAEYDAVPSLIKTPIWAVHNSADIFVPCGGTEEMVTRINSSGGHAQFTKYGAFGHNCWDTAYADPQFVSWLQSQHK